MVVRVLIIGVEGGGVSVAFREDDGSNNQL